MQRLGMERGEAIEHKMVNRAIENAQKKVEGMNYDARKQLLEYDDVANDQRKVIYKIRNELMSVDDVSEKIIEIRKNIIKNIMSQHISGALMEDEWRVDDFTQLLKTDFGTDIPVQKWVDQGLDIHEIEEAVIASLEMYHEIKEKLAGKEKLREFEKALMLQVLDHFWKEHLASMDYLRQSVNLRGYAQKNPIQEFKKESYEMFTELLDTIDYETIKALSLVQIDKNTSADDLDNQSDDEMSYNHQENNNSETNRKIGRNEPCPCGSGKKYKQCHGKS